MLEGGSVRQGIVEHGEVKARVIPGYFLVADKVQEKLWEIVEIVFESGAITYPFLLQTVRSFLCNRVNAM